MALCITHWRDADNCLHFSAVLTKVLTILLIHVWERIPETIGIESITVEIGASQWEKRIQPEENPQII